MDRTRVHWQFPFDATSVILGYFSYSAIFQKWIAPYNFQVNDFFGVNAIFLFLLVFFLSYGIITRFKGIEFDLLHRIRTYLPVIIGALIADFVDLLVTLISGTVSNLNILTLFFTLVFLLILSFVRISIFIIMFEIGSKIANRIVDYYKESAYKSDQIIFGDEFPNK